MRTLITSAMVKSRESDPIATTLPQNMDSVVHIITKNLSLKYDEMSNILKEALLRPLLKKSNLDLIFKHYHPVLNMSYISKLIKRAVCNQIMNYTKEMGNLEELQSAYREGHSMESAQLLQTEDIDVGISRACMLLFDSELLQAIHSPI